MNIPFVLALLGTGFIGGQILSVSIMSGVRVSFLDVTLAAVLLFGAYKSRKPFDSAQGKRRFIPRLWAPILAFTLVSLISRGDLFYIIRWLLYAALYWVTADAFFPPRLWRNILAVSGIGIALLGFVQYVLYPDLRNLYYLGWDPHYQRLFSTLLDPNFTGIIMAFTALILLPMLRRGKSPWVVGGLMATLGALLLTYSRSSIGAFVVGLVVWGMFTKRTVLVAAIAFGFIMTFAVLPHTGEGRNVFRTVSSFARIDSAKQALTLIREKPILGHGIRPRAGIDTSLLFLAESTGVVGVLVYGWLLVSLCRLGVRGLAYKKTREEAASYLSVLAALLVHSLFVNSLFYPWVMAWVWVSTGALEQEVYPRSGDYG
ncbi:MAG TPA: O-antigen ligase family protein [Patescibacteria group bacterium]|nr:O-antigen ligase family protein [Patescibacteria group bacterium]